jgi:tetratricopeptide (TPR) repeat protein
MTDYFDLGSHSYSITTGSVEAQIWFDRGLIWCYGFNHEEAVRCFEKTVELDPQCAMGYWGIAYASSSFYNKPWAWFGDDERVQSLKICYENIHKAKQLSSNSTLSEQLLISALCDKHQREAIIDLSEPEQWEKTYSDSMRELQSCFPNDLDIICLTAESMMNLTRWKLWDIQLGIPAADALTEASIELLEQGLKIIQQSELNSHPGILHFYIHALEMSPQPELALPAADQLRDLSPESGHLLHMATHIDVLCGQYSEAVEANNKAITADLKYIDLRGKHEFYMISCVHDFHSRMYAAMFAGQFAPALQAADSIRSIISEDLLHIDSRYLASTLEAYYSSKVHVLVRFGRWQAIVDEPLPEDPTLYPVTTALLYYGKTISHAALGDIRSARQCKSKFDQLHEAIPDWHIMANNSTRDIFAVAAAMSNGELEYHAGNHEVGYAHLREACELSDNLAYSEPWPWMHPPRHALGALLLEQGHVEEAMQHYGADLGINNTLPRCLQHRDNIWALHGYLECLNRLGQTDGIDAIQQKLNRVIVNADIKIDSSCCCRKNVYDGGS